MKRLGIKKTKTKVVGHQECGLCHPKTKSGRSKAKNLWVREIPTSIEAQKAEADGSVD